MAGGGGGVRKGKGATENVITKWAQMGEGGGGGGGGYRNCGNKKKSHKIGDGGKAEGWGGGRGEGVAGGGGGGE